MHRRLDKGDWVKFRLDCQAFIKQLQGQNKDVSLSNDNRGADEYWIISKKDGTKICKAPEPLKRHELTGKERPFWD